MAYLRLASILLLASGCSIYVGDDDDPPIIDPPDEVPATCDRAYRAAIFEPAEGAVVTNPVHVRYRWVPGDQPDRYMSLIDETGRIGGYGDEYYEGQDNAFDVTLEPGLGYSFEIGWICVWNGGADSLDMPLATRSFTVVGE